MKTFKNKKVILTGAVGGIGSELAKLLADEGAKLILISSNEEKLKKLSAEIKDSNYVVADFSSHQGIKDAAAIISEIDNVDCLINLAGISYFGSFGLQKFDDIIKLYNVNTLAPVLLSQAVLPEMIKNNSGHIVNIGSIVGSIGFPFFTTYSSSKAALLSFCEALRREISQSDVKVSYIAPRTVKTPINDENVMEFHKKVGSKIDEPIAVAKKIMNVIIKEKKYCYFGFAESKFVKINYLLPSLVDKALESQALIAREIISTKL